MIEKFFWLSIDSATNSPDNAEFNQMKIIAIIGDILDCGEKQKSEMLPIAISLALRKARLDWTLVSISKHEQKYMVIATDEFMHAGSVYMRYALLLDALSKIIMFYQVNKLISDEKIANILDEAGIDYGKYEKYPH